MFKAKKNILLILVGVIMLLAMSFAVFAEEASIIASGSCGKNTSWVLYEAGDLVISGKGKIDSATWNDYKNNVKAITIQNGVTNIPENAFEYFTVSKIIIPNSVTEIERYAFEGAYVKVISIPNTVSYIGTGAFEHFNTNSALNIPTSITKIYADTYRGASGLSTAKIPSSVTFIGDNAFADSDITDVTIPETVTNMGNGVFKESSIEKVEFLASMSDINPETFEKCYNLKDVYIKNGVELIGYDAFLDCTSLKEIVLPYTTKVIGEDAFWRCERLTSLICGTESVKVYYSAFSYIPELTIYAIPGTGLESAANYNNIPFVEHTHSMGKWKVKTKAGFSSEGEEYRTCNVCRAEEFRTVARIKSVSLSDKSFVYNGKVQVPTITVKDSNNKTVSDSNYSLTYSNRASKAIGSYTIKVTFTGKYSGSKTLSYKIVPKQVTDLKTSTVKTTSIKLTWTKVAGAKYYKVEKYDSSSKKWVAVKTVDTNSYTVSKLKAGTKYQFRVTALDSTKKIAGKTSVTLKTGTLTVAPTVTFKSSKSKTAVASWKKVTGAVKYIVYKSTDGKKWTKVTTTTKLTYTLTKLTGGKKIYVKVIAVNAYDKSSAASTVKSVTVKK